MPRMPQGKSKDPNQQRLRDHKREWSDSTSALIAKIIAFKRGLNGRGDAKVGLPPSSIKEALPTEVGSLLNQLATDFQKIVADAESIIAEQDNYSKTRRRRRPKGAPGVTAPSVEPSASPLAEEPDKDKIVDTLSRIGSQSDYYLEAVASNKLTRIWQYITSIFSRKEFSKQRIGLLSQSADLLNSLEEFENAILSIRIDSIPAAIGKYKDFKYVFNAFDGTYSGVVDLIARKSGIKIPEKNEKKPEADNSLNKPADKPKEVVNDSTVNPVTPVDNKPKEKTSPQISKIKQDIHSIFNANLAKDEVINLGKMIEEHDNEEDPHMKPMWEERIQDSYKDLLTNIANEVQKKYGPAQIKNLQDILNHIKKNKTALEISESEFIKVAHNAITRSLKRNLLKTLKFNKTSVVRLQISELIDDTYKIINQIMDSLEKDLSVEEINGLLEKMKENMEGIKKPLHVLNVFYMKEFFAKRERNKQVGRKNQPAEPIDDPMYDSALKRKLRRDIYEDIS